MVQGFPPPGVPPQPPFAPMMGNPAMEQHRPHDFERVHIIEPQLHNRSIPTPDYEDPHLRGRSGIDRRESVSNGKDNGKEFATYEGYTFQREPASRTPGQKQTWAVAKRSIWRAGQSDLKELVKKQQKKNGTAWAQLNADEMIGLKRNQVDRLLQDRNTDRRNDPRTEYEIAAIKIDRFQVKGGGLDAKMTVVLKRRLRSGVRPDPFRPIAPAPPVEQKEVIYLTGFDGSERSSEGSYPSPHPHHTGHAAFPFPSQPPPPRQHGGQPRVQIFDDRFPQQQQHHMQPLGQEQQRGPPMSHPMSPVLSDEGSDNFRPGVKEKDFNFKDEERSRGSKMQRQNSSNSSSASEVIEVLSVGSDETRPTTISSGRSTYGGDRRSFNASPQRKPIATERINHGSNSKKEKKHGQDNFHDRSGSLGHDTHSGSFKKDKKAMKHPQDNDTSDSDDRGRSGKKDKRYYHGGYQHTSHYHERDGHSAGYKKDKKISKDSHRHNSPSLERDEYGDHSRSHKQEKKHSKDDRRYKTSRHHRDEREPPHYATREHERKAPVYQSRASWSDGSRPYTDDEFVVIPGGSSRRRGPPPPPPRRHFAEQARAPIIEYDSEERRDRDLRGIGRHSSIYRAKIANKPYRGDLDERAAFAREQREHQRQLDLEEDENFRIEEIVQQELAREDEEIRRENRRRDQIAREESEQRIRIKARERLMRARMARERPYEMYDDVPLTRRMSAVYR